jgi:DNA-binding response OmpR family regulator
MTRNKTDKKRILIIDDDTIVLKMLAEIFRTRGYEVTTENDSTRAPGGAMNADLIILDLLLSDKCAFEGKTVLEQLWSNPSFSTPVILYSGHIKRDSIREGLEWVLRPHANGRKIYRFIEKNEDIQPLINAVTEYFS